MYEWIIIFCAQYLYILIVLIAFGFFFVTRQTKKPNEVFMITFLASGLALLIDKAFNQIIYSPRPFTIEGTTPLFIHAADNGFPSEHTLFAAVLAGIVFLYSKKLGVVLMVLAIMVGAARVLARVHHPIDILGSLMIAVTSIYIAQYAIPYLKGASKSGVDNST